MKHSHDILDLTVAAIPGWDRKRETGLTARVAELLATNANRRVWCASSATGAGRNLRKLKNVKRAHTGVRDHDLAYGRLWSDGPNDIIQYKYDRGATIRNKRSKESCGTNPFLDALSDLVYLGVEFRRLGERPQCRVVSVVHEVSRRKREWAKLCDGPEMRLWTLKCEPQKVCEGHRSSGLVFPEQSLIRPDTISRICRVFGTKFQRRDYGLFLRPGKLTLTFASRYTQVEEFTVFDWWIRDVGFSGAKEDASLETWLP